MTDQTDDGAKGPIAFRLESAESRIAEYKASEADFREASRKAESELARLNLALGKAQGEAEGHALVRKGVESELAAERARVRELEEHHDDRVALAEAERGLAAWEALANLDRARYDVVFPGRRTMGDYAGSVGDRTKRELDQCGCCVTTPRVLGEGATPTEAAIALAEKLTLPGAGEKAGSSQQRDD